MNIPTLDNLPTSHNRTTETPQPPQYLSPESHSIAQLAATQPECWENIPFELRQQRRWCVAGPSLDPDQPKAPHAVTERGHHKANVLKPQGWVDFETAVKYANRFPDVLPGFMTGDGFACIDLDVKDHTSQECQERFASIIQQFDSYTEWSRSGKGWHVWIKADIGRGSKRDGVELYSQQRFIVCTGNVYRQGIVQERQYLAEMLQGQLNRNLANSEILLNEPTDFSEAPYVANQLFDEDGNWKNERYRKLAMGEWKDLGFESGSDADLDLVKILARHTNLDGSVWAAFQLLPQGQREKDGRRKSDRPDYKRRTLGIARQHLANDALAEADGRAIAEGMFWKMQTTEAKGLIAKPLGAFLQEFEAIEFLIDDMFRRGWLYTVTGSTGAGKTAIAVTIALHIAAGRPLGANEVNRGPVLYIAGENPDDVRGRFKAAIKCEGWPNEVLSAIHVIDQSFLLVDRLEELEQIIDTLQPAAVFIDTDQALSLCGDSDENNNGVRMQHAKNLRRLVRRDCRPTVLDLCHPNGSATRENMKPRGGSAFLNEIDGNVGCWRDGDMTAFFTDPNKFRGAPFEFSFHKRLELLDEVKDTKGRRIPVPVFTLATSDKEVQVHLEELADNDKLLQSISMYPDWNQATHGKSLSWDKTKVSKQAGKLRALKLLGEGLSLTPQGKKRANGFRP